MTRYRRTRGGARSWLLLLVCSSACAPSQWQRPIGQFTQAMDGGATVVGTYYDDLNAYERRLYLHSVLLDPEQEILMKDAEGKPTPLAGRVFSAASIKARQDALGLVTEYAGQLADLAGSEAPEAFAAGAAHLGEAISALPGTLTALGGTDPAALDYVKPVSGLLGLVGRIVLERRRDAALALAIAEGEAPVTVILDLIDRDLASAVGPLRATGEKQVLAELVGDYNARRGEMSFEERKRRIEEVATATDSYAAAVSANPARVVAAMRSAHQSLVRYARSPRKPADLAELASAVDLLTARVEAGAAAIQALRAAR